MSNDSELDLDLLLDEDDELNSSSRGTHGTHDEDLDEKERPAASHDDDDESFFSDDDDDDDDVKPKQNAKPDTKADVNGDDDDEEEEEEEIIKPALNPVIVGFGALAVVVLAGGAGYVMLNKNNSEQSSDSPTVTTSMPAPSFEELGKDLSIPSTNLVDEDAEKPIDAGSALAQAKAHAEPLAPAKAVVEPPVTAPVVAQKIDAPVVHDVALVDQGAKVTPVTPVAAAVPSLAATSSTPGATDGDDNVSKQELKQMVADAVKDVVSTNQSEELKAEVATLKKELDEAKAHPTSEAALSEYKAKVIGEIRQNREKKELAKAEASKQLVEKAIEGKKRLPGFQVVNATVDGQISIIKAPSGRTFALFKGEKFKAANGSLLEVKEIVAEGKLVVAGDSWFIDDVVEKVQKVDIPKSAPAGSAVVQKPASSKKRESSAPVEKTTSISGWSFHASFEGGGYLVKTPSGEYKTIKRGENESGLGVIYGVDDNGNLKTEKGVIKGEL
jgi:hypothetical protein